MTTLTPEQFQQQGGQVQPTQSDASNMFQTFANNVKAGTVSATPDPTQGILQKFGNVANTVGVSKLGQGLATAEMEATGQENQAGDSQAAAAKQLSDIMAKYPVGSPQRIAAVKTWNQTYKNGVPTQADIDPGTALSDRDVIGSAVSTAGLALGGGELEGATAATEGAEGAETAKNLSTGEKVLQGAKTGAKVGGAIGATQGLGGGLQNDKENALQVGEDTLKGGTVGAVTGGVGGALISGASEGIGKLQNAVADASTEQPKGIYTDNKEVASQYPEQKPNTTRIYTTNRPMQSGQFVDTDLDMHTGRGTAAEPKYVADIPDSEKGKYLEPVDEARSKQGEMKIKQGINIPEKHIVYNGENTESYKGRLADATPDYNKKMVGENVRNAEGKSVPRVNEGEGLTGKRTVNASGSEIKNGQELAKIKNYPDEGTNLQKSQAVHNEISTEAEGMKTKLAEEDKARPLVPEAKDQIYKGVFDKMNSDARDAFVSRGRGLEEKAGIPVESARSVSGRYGQDVADALGDYDGSRVGLQNLKEKVDDIYQDARGKSAFGTEHRNALDDMHTAVRSYLRDELAESTASTDVKSSLDKQNKLYRAKDVLDTKAEAEATSKLGRIMKSHPQLGFLSRFAERRGLYEALKLGAELATGGGAIYGISKAVSKK